MRDAFSRTGVALLLIAVPTLFLPLSLWADGDVDPKSLETAKQFAGHKERQKLIAFFAHPTCKLTSVDYQKSAKKDKGFTLVYKFNLRSPLNRSFYSKLALGFDIDGNYRSIDFVATSSLIDPFTATSTVVRMVENRLKDTPGLRTREVRMLIDMADVKGLLKVMLRAVE